MKTRISGSELKVIRTLRDLKAVDVANVLDRAASSVCYVESGNRNLDEVQSEKVMKEFDVDEDLLSLIRRVIRLANV